MKTPKISSSLQENNMSGAMTVLAVAAVASTAYSIYSGERAAEKQQEALGQQRTAQAEAKTAAEKQQATAEQNVNRANAKQPDAGAILSQASQAAKGGPAGTMLTGPMGINTADLNLGKSTLLGG
jgi:type II secretory pathway pseudopilin PulG